MSSLQTLKDKLPDYARDTRVNLGNVLSDDVADLSPVEVAGTALAAAYFTNHDGLINALEQELAAKLDDHERTAIKGAVAIMAMNNVYYRTLHIAEDEGLNKLPANLRMQIIGKPGIEKRRFEIYSLAISTLAGCGRCVSAHIMELRKAGATDLALQNVVRIAAVINATAAALRLEKIS